MTAVPNLHDLTAADQTPPALFARTEADLTVFMDRAKPIIEAVRREGDAALRRARWVSQPKPPPLSVYRETRLKSRVYQPG